MNWHIVLLISCLCLNSLAFDMPSHYHTTSQMNSELHSLSQRCSFITLQDALTEPMVKQITINQGSEKNMKAYLLFGEHPRELISPETGLNFLRDLCYNPGSAANSRILDDYEVRMILNANPVSREGVEGGQFCLRENENGVDLNRNYDAHWKHIQDDSQQTTSGTEPFSEPETRAIRDSMKGFGANVFLSVHSGTLGMYTPHAYSEDDGEFNEGNMKEVLDNLSEKYCPSCEVGAAGREVGYLAPGSCIDYAYDELSIKYSFAVEIFHQDIDLPREVSDNSRDFVSFLQVNETPRERRNRIQQKMSKNPLIHGSCFLETKSKYQQLSDESCFHYFNPEDQQDYNWYVNNWTSAIQDMLITISDKESSEIRI